MILVNILNIIFQHFWNCCQFQSTVMGYFDLLSRSNTFKIQVLSQDLCITIFGYPLLLIFLAWTLLCHVHLPGCLLRRFLFSFCIVFFNLFSYYGHSLLIHFISAYLHPLITLPTSLLYTLLYTGLYLFSTMPLKPAAKQALKST